MENKQNKINDLEKFDSKLSESLDKLLQLDSFNSNDFDSLSRLVEEQTCKYVACAAQNSVKPQSKEGQRLIDKFNLIRKVGNRFVNMFKIEFKITFCGVVLCHLEIPKLETNDRKD